MESENGFNLHAGSFDSKKKKEAKDTDNIEEEERKEELTGSITKIATSRISIKGGFMGVEEERIGREAET